MNLIPEEYQIWSADECARYLGLNRSYFINEICKKPDFPKMARCSTPRRLLWRKVDFLKWATGSKN